VAEKTAPNNVVIGAVEFKKEWLSRCQSTKLNVATRLPEVDFVQTV
jgi:hypothetical protein